MHKLNASQWSEYWEKGTITTFHKHFDNNYDGEIREFWFDCFAQQKSKAKVVDLATGNGALVQLLAAFAYENKTQFHIDAVDFAAINPALDSNQFCEINFYPKTSIESSGLQGSDYDLIISQFGLEYADLSKAFVEIDRIACPNSNLGLIVHSHNSRIIQQGQDALKQLEFISKKARILPIIRQLLTRMEKLSKRGINQFQQDNKAERLRAKLNHKISTILDFSDSQDDPAYLTYIIESAMQVFKTAPEKRLTLEQKLNILNQVEIESLSFHERMEDLLAAALTEPQLQYLLEQIQACGYKISINEDLIYKGSLMGRKIYAQRRS